jgi:PPP family 3-phenylpropionic acid transporter
MAITLATKIVAPNIWGWIADRTGRRISIVRWACLGTTLAFSGVYGVGHSFLGLALVMLLFSFFWNAALPQFEAITLNHLGNDIHRYSRIRLWGSLGFIAMALVAGGLSQYWGITVVPTVLLALFTALWLNSLLVPDRPALLSPRAAPPFLTVLRQPLVLVLLAVCFLNQFSHGPYYAFFSIYLKTLGYQPGVIGLLWNLGVVAEVVLFLWMPRLLPRLGARRLLLVTLALAGVRWWLIGRYADCLPLLLIAQALHAFSFGVYHAVAISLIHRLFTGPHQGRGQALYSSLSFGAGGSLGSLSAGYLWTSWGSEWTYALAAAVSLLSLVLAWRGLRVEPSP